MTTPPLPIPITVEGNRTVYTRAQLIAYGKACFTAGQATPTAAPSDNVSKLFKAFGMTP